MAICELSIPKRKQCRINDHIIIIFRKETKKMEFVPHTVAVLHDLDEELK